MSTLTVLTRNLPIFLYFIFLTGTSYAEDPVDYRRQLEAAADASLGGPQSASAQLEEDRVRRQEASRMPGLDALFDPFEVAKEQLREETGLNIGLDYQIVYQHSSTSLTGSGEGAAGHARMIGNWTLFNRDGANPGSLVFILENRHKLGTQTTPASLAGEIGYIGLTSTTFSDTGNSLSVAHWAQSISGGRGGFVAGRIDPTDYTDILGYVNPRTTFMNLAVLFNPVIPLPDPGFGIGGGWFLSDQVYALGVLSDANGSLTDVNWFPGGSELYKYAEIGWTPAKDQRYLTNIHISGFHQDKRKEAAVSESYGVLVSGNVTFENGLMLFGRIGFSKGTAPIAKAAGTVGFMWRPGFYDDLLGVAVNVAQPVNNALDVQTSFEAFYRFDASDNLAISADVQWLLNPALNSAKTSVGVFGLRARMNM
jgi:porin